MKSEIKGRIVALNISKKKGVPKTNVESVNLITDWGIEGDVHAGNWHRQISFLALESVNKMREKGLNVRPGAFAENITTEFVDIPNLHIGDIVKVRNAEFEITQIGKECHSKCAIYYKAGDCVMPREGIFARVIVGDKITVGDELSVFSNENKISSAILAGGGNTRMGTNKALLLFDGKTFIQRTNDLLKDNFHSSIIISDKDEEYYSANLKIQHDIYKACGPLGGIHSALVNSEAESVFIISCDLPLITTDIIRQLLILSADVVVPSYKNIIQPLCGIYRRSLLPSLETFLNNGGRKVHDFIKTVNSVVVPFDSVNFPVNPFMSINTPEQYETLITEVVDD
jgi:molybdopterin-guanine dinucleotide biosynthesis protein A